MRIPLIAAAVLMAATTAPVLPGMAQPAPPKADPPSGPSGDRNFNDIRMGLGVQGEMVFNKVCSACHKPDGQVGADSRAPHQETLRQFPPERIYDALEAWMRQSGQRLGGSAAATSARTFRSRRRGK